MKEETVKTIANYTEEISKLTKSKELLKSSLGDQATHEIEGIDKYINVIVNRINSVVLENVENLGIAELEEKEKEINRIKEEIEWWNKVLPKLQDSSLREEKKTILDELENRIKELEK